MPAHSYYSEYPPGSSRLYLLKESARFIWERYRGGRSSEQIAERLARRYEIDLGTARRPVSCGYAVHGKPCG